VWEEIFAQGVAENRTFRASLGKFRQKSFAPQKVACTCMSENDNFSVLIEMQTERSEKNKNSYSTGAVMVLVWQVYRLLH